VRLCLKKKKCLYWLGLEVWFKWLEPLPTKHKALSLNPVP
jgi:hypothetical protein